MLKKLTAHVLAAALLLAALLLPAAIDADSGWVVKEMTVGEAFSLVLMDGVNDGHSTVSIVRGSLPPGLSLDQVIDHSMMRWVVQGTPTAAGVYRAQFLLEPWQNGAPAETSNVYVEFDVSGGAPELVIMTTSLPNGVAGEHYNFRIQTNYPQNAVTFTEYYMQGHTTIMLSDVGLELRTDGTITGTPTRETYFSVYFSVHADGAPNGDVIAGLRLKINANPNQTPTPQPTDTPTPDPDITPEPTATPEPTVEPTSDVTPGPTIVPTSDTSAEPSAEPSPEPTPEASDEPWTGDNGVPNCTFAAESIISYVPDRDFDYLLLSGLGGNCRVGSLPFGLPDGVKLTVDNETGECSIRGKITEDEMNDPRSPLAADGSFAFILPIVMNDGFTYTVCYRLEPTEESLDVSFPAGTPLAVGFGG
ncbi:MAG: hypothetical protein J5544_02515 [Clostridia bacterium]|nr:hypothetical protein [Clostridia bacterium]